MCTKKEWLRKHGITTIVAAPDHPGPYRGTGHATKSRYKEELWICNEYKEHMRKSIKALTSCFPEGLLIDLETDGEVIGYTTIEIYDHTKDNFLLPRDLLWEITKTQTDY